MASEKDVDFVCSVCLNLDFGRLPKPDPPHTLDEYQISTSFQELRDSAQNDDCLACKIICTGIESVQEEYEESEFLLDDTRVIMNLRQGHSVRVTLSNFGYEKVLEFYTISPEDNGSIPAFGTSSTVASSMNLSHCLRLAAGWMKKCREEHALCRRAVDSKLPTRVIDVGLRRESETVYLKETRDSDRDPYISLSHCWGKEQIITTTTNTLQKRKAGIKFSELSNTFREAVQITRGLGIRYLWIDSLCIIQDDKKDWEIESAKMADVYMGSQLNLAATHASNGLGGCFAERWSLDTLNQVELNVGDDVDILIRPDDDEEGDYSILVRTALHVAHDHFTRTMDYASTMEHASPLLSRGWVFQERLLSMRALHFHAEELIWECASGISCECSRLEEFQGGDPNGLLQQRETDQIKMMYLSMFSTTATESQILDTWLELISEYGALKLTKQTDRLPAISGLASRISRQLTGEYLGGLWSQDLPRALCWEKGSGSRNKYPSFHDADSSAPSWSWASISNHSDDVPGITYGIVTVSGFVVDPRCHVPQFYQTRSLNNPFGICADAWLKIRAPLITATFLATESPMDQETVDLALKHNFAQYLGKTMSWNEIEFEEETTKFSGDCLDTEGRVTDVSHGDTVCCLLLGHFKHTEKERLSEYPPQYLNRDQRRLLESENSSSETKGAYALVLVKVDESSTYKRVGFLVQREGSGWWEDAEICTITLI
ncbi:heterokaryon incompatibility protein-domain-containing protein [Halenospora varia]|nr:heterokaryon incompatibility protein-domain-containing protein [Halenospora varia]